MKIFTLVCFLLLATVTNAAAQSGSSSAPDCAKSNGPLPEQWSGTAFAIDGETLSAFGLKQHIRIWGIQAPELRDKLTGRDSTPATRARAALAALLVNGKKNVSCRILKFDRYCRIVAQCEIKVDAPSEVQAKPVAVDLGQRMIAIGMASSYDLDDTLPWAPSAGVEYAQAEELARKQRIGLWKDWLSSR